MNTLDLHTTLVASSPPRFPLLHRLRAILPARFCAWRKRRQRQNELKHIAHFPPYLLRDIGLSAEDIAHMRSRPHFASTDTLGRPDYRPG